jgi:hypothetical protein
MVADVSENHLIGQIPEKNYAAMRIMGIFEKEIRLSWERFKYFQRSGIWISWKN